MSLIYDPDMTISVVDQSAPTPEIDTPVLDTALSGVWAGFTSKGRHNVIVESKSPAALLSEFGDDFGSFTKFGLANTMALNFARSGGRVFFCSLIPDDAKRAYSVFGVSVKRNAALPVYERTDTRYNEDRTQVLSFGTGAFKLDKSGNKIQCTVKEQAADSATSRPVTTEGVEITLGTKKLEDNISNFSSDGAPDVFSGEPIVTQNDDNTETTFYPLFTTYYYSNGKGGNDYGYRISRYTSRDKKTTDGRRYSIEFFKLLSTGSYTNLYDEPYYFAFNPAAKYSEESNKLEGLSQVYVNETESGEPLPIQMITYDENYQKILDELAAFKDESETNYDIDFINCLFKNGNPYTKIVLSAESIDASSALITLDYGTDGSLEVGATVNGKVITAEDVAAKKEELLIKFFSCDVDDDIFDEKLTDIDYVFDADYSMDVKKTILGQFHQYRPDICPRINVGKTSGYSEAIMNANELAAYVYPLYNFMVSFSAHYGTLTDSRVGSPYRVPDTYDLACVEADNFAAVGGQFQMHAGSSYGRVKYFRPDWIAKKNKVGMTEKLKEARLNYIEILNKRRDRMWGSETSQYLVDNSKLCSNRNALVIGRAMRICRGILPYYKYDPRSIADTLKAATSNCRDALASSNIPNTIGIDVSMYQTKEDQRTENAHCDIIFTFPNYAKTFTVTIYARRPAEV